MKNRLLALALALGGTVFAISSSAQAQIPVIRNGAPVFRAAYFSPNGPQPFSTRRSRELAAARARGDVGRGTIFGGSFSRYQNSGRVFQPARRSGIFSRRVVRFR